MRRLTGAEWHWSVHTGTLVCLFVCVFVRAAAVAAQLELMVSRYLEVILVGSSVHPKPCSACSFRTVCLYAAFTHLRCSVHHPTPSRTHDHILQRCALQRCALQDRRFAPRALHFALPGAPFALPVVYAVDDTAADADAPLLQQR